MAETMGSSLAQTVASDGATRGVAVAGRFAQKLRGVSAPPETVDAYRALQLSVMRCQMRIQVLHAVHGTQWNPLQLVGQFTGFPLLVGMLERLGQDFAAITRGWRRVAQLGSPEARRVSDELLLALDETVSQTDPGWIRPSRRRHYREEAPRLHGELERLNSRFDLRLRRHLHARDQWIGPRPPLSAPRQRFFMSPFRHPPETGASAPRQRRAALRSFRLGPTSAWTTNRGRSKG